jgi:hypothetical protein
MIIEETITTTPELSTTDLLRQIRGRGNRTPPLIIDIRQMTDEELQKRSDERLGKKNDS